MAIPGVTPSALALDDPDFYLADPHAAFRWMRERAPVYRCERARLWAISKHADIMRVSRNPEIFCSARGILINDGLRGETPMEVPPSIIYMDPPQHNRYRKLVSRAFTPGMVAGLEGRTRAIARESLDAIRSGETHDFVETVAVPLPMLVIAEMLGVAAEDRGTFKRWSDAIIAAADTGTSPESMQHVGELFAYFYAKLGERRGRLLSALAAAEVDGERLADEELLMFCMTLLVAGNETTRNLISGGAKALMEFPDQRRALVENPDRLPGAVEEMLRWVTPIRSFARTATRDTEIRGQRIAAGTTCSSCTHRATATRRSSAPPRTCSTWPARRNRCTWPSGSASTSAWVRASHASRRACCSRSSSAVFPTSRWRARSCPCARRS